MQDVKLVRGAESGIHTIQTRQPKRNAFVESIGISRAYKPVLVIVKASTGRRLDDWLDHLKRDPTFGQKNAPVSQLVFLYRKQYHALTLIGEPEGGRAR